MRAESERYLVLLEQRLMLLEALSRTLAASRADFVALDLEAVRTRLREQEQFCGQIRALDGDITQAQARYAKLVGFAAHPNEIFWPDCAGSDAALSERIGETMRRVAAAQVELKRLNDAHQSLLRRSAQTVHVLLNLFRSYAPSYALPATPKTGTLCEERV